MTRTLLLAIFSATVFFNIVFVKLSVGLPVRSILAVSAILILEWLRPQAVHDAISKCMPLLLTLVYFSGVGLVLTVANGDSITGALGPIIENYAQSAISIVLIYAMCLVVGLRAVSGVVMVAILISVAFAVLQFVGVQPAWDIKHSLDIAQGVYPQLFQGRPGGLSYTPVHLGYQVCILFALFCVWAMVARERNYLIIGLVVVFVASIAAGNRSPLLSIAVFGLLYAQRFHPRGVLMLLPLAFVGVPLLSWLLDLASSAEVRALEAGDSSSVGRAVLSYYGVLLVSSNIFGHGLVFDTQLHWPEFWDQLRGFENSTIVQRYGLHNYTLNMLVTFGVFVIPPVVMLLRNDRMRSMFFWTFLLYFINTLTHNEGPFYADNMFWYGAICVMFLAQNSNLVFHAEQFRRGPAPGFRGAVAMHKAEPMAPTYPRQGSV